MVFECDSPEENLAWDDNLLAGEQEALRLWESPVPFVVMGRSGQVEREVRLPVNIPVLRRSSGGGTVLQGPGCLNYTLVLSLTSRPILVSVERSYTELLSAVVRTLGIGGLEVVGSDILYQSRKISGNAQRRSRGWLLHHGTILYEPFHLADIEHTLREPFRQPPHRQGRPHHEFLTKLPIAREELVTRLLALAHM